MALKNVIFTIGHSTRSTREFIKILQSFEIELLVDVRHYPHSRYCPQFEKARLKRNLAYNRIQYIHLESLGGRRQVNSQSALNAGWRSAQFRGYADYMLTKEFLKGLIVLMRMAEDSQTAIMCAEALPWRCHRSLLSDYLLLYGFEVYDLFDEKNLRPHFLTPFASVNDNQITYPKN